MSILIDRNVLIYMVDGSDEQRRQRAIEVVTVLWAAGEGRLSAQCLLEFFHLCSMKISTFVRCVKECGLLSI